MADHQGISLATWLRLANEYYLRGDYQLAARVITHLEFKYAQ